MIYEENRVNVRVTSRVGVASSRIVFWNTAPKVSSGTRKIFREGVRSQEQHVYIFFKKKSNMYTRKSLKNSSSILLLSLVLGKNQGLAVPTVFFFAF